MNKDIFLTLWEMTLFSSDLRVFIETKNDDKIIIDKYRFDDEGVAIVGKYLPFYDPFAKEIYFSFSDIRYYGLIVA